jgi:Bardet-Biedl syndrome 9 protein
VAKLVPPLKNPAFKFTLDTNRAPPALPALFEDMLSQPGMGEEMVARITGANANVLSFQYYAGHDATILVSKSSGRYRVQSGSLEALWVVSSELVRRLSGHFGSGGGRAGAGVEPFTISYEEPLPLADFFACIDAHFDARKQLAKANSDLNDRAQQFRLVQKRLLVRYKDRNPAPLNNLDMLFQTTYTALQAAASRVQEAQAAQAACARRLSCATQLVLMLMRYRFSLDSANFDILSCHLSPDVGDGEVGWEESVDAAITHLLRTVLAKTSREVATAPQTLTMPEDTSRLKRHIAIVCDRLGKGARLHRPPAGRSGGGGGR